MYVNSLGTKGRTLQSRVSFGKGMKGREGKGREGKGREGKGREGILEIWKNGNLFI